MAAHKGQQNLVGIAVPATMSFPEVISLSHESHVLCVQEASVTSVYPLKSLYDIIKFVGAAQILAASDFCTQFHHQTPFFKVGCHKSNACAFFLGGVGTYPQKLDTLRLNLVAHFTKYIQ